MSNYNNGNVNGKLLDLPQHVEATKNYKLRNTLFSQEFIVQACNNGYVANQDYASAKRREHHNPTTVALQSIKNTEDDSRVDGINKPPYDMDSVEEHNERVKQIQFLEMVMFEYLQRALFHNVLLDNLMFQKKATEVRNCIGIPYFRPSFLWLKNFMRKFDIHDLSLESLKSKIQFTEEKLNSLDAVDLVCYVRQHQKDLCKAEVERKKRLANATKPILFPSSTINGRHYKKRLVYVRKDHKSPKTTFQQTQFRHIKKYMPEVLSTCTSQRSFSGLKNCKDPLKQSDLTRITVQGGKPKVKKAICEKDLPLVTGRTSLGENGIQKIFATADAEVVEFCASPKQQCTSSSLSDIAETPYVVCCPESRVEMFTINFLDEGTTVKTEPHCIEVSVGKEKQTNHDQKLFDNFENTNLTGGEIIIKAEKDSSQWNEEIKPDLDFKSCEEFLKENTIKPNDLSQKTDKRPLSTEVSNELVMENKEWQTRYYTQSPLPDIDTPREALKLIHVLENYAMWIEDHVAIELLAQLEQTLKKQPKNIN